MADITRIDRIRYATRLKERLAADTVVRNLALSGAVVALHDLLKNEIIRGPRGFFDIGGWSDDTETYQRDVLAKDPKSIFRASCLWLVDMEAIDEADLTTIEMFRDHRHRLAHELAPFLIDPDAEIDLELLVSIADVVRRIGVFWGRINIDINGDFDGQEIADEDIRSGPSIVADHILAALLGPEDPN